MLKGVNVLTEQHNLELKTRATVQSTWLANSIDGSSNRLYVYYILMVDYILYVPKNSTKRLACCKCSKVYFQFKQKAEQTQIEGWTVDKIVFFSIRYIQF